MISPPRRTRMTRPPRPSAIHSAPSASRPQPSGATTTWASSFRARCRSAVRRTSPRCGGWPGCILGDVECGDAVTEGLVYQQRAVLGDHAAVGEPQVLGGLGDGPVGIDAQQATQLEVGPAHEVEPELADEGPAVGVDHHVVEMPVDMARQVRVTDQGAVGLAARRGRRAWRRSGGGRREASRAPKAAREPRPRSGYHCRPRPPSTPGRCRNRRTRSAGHASAALPDRTCR